jgi:hypothetical protein
MASPRYGDSDHIQSVYEKARERSSTKNTWADQYWMRNILYYLGLQWISPNVGARKWEPKVLKKWVPKPVTNKFATHANTIIQVLGSKSPDITAQAGGDDPDDVASGDVGNRLIPVIASETKYEEARRIRAAWLVFTGNVFLHPCYDPSPQHGMTQIPMYQCQEEGCDSTPVPADEVQEGCPECGSPNLAEAMDEAGEPITEGVPTGKCKLEVFSPFEVFIDLEARTMDEVHEILIRRRYPLDEVKLNPKWQPRAATLEADKREGGTGTTYLRSIAAAAGSGSPGSGGSNPADELGITIDILWKRPNEEFPGGLVAAFANDLLLNEKPEDQSIPYHDHEGKPLWNWYHIPFDRVPGRLLGKTPMDDVAPKQEQRNKLESLIQLIVTRCSNPVWLLPKNSGVTMITGEPGQVLEGNWFGDPRMKPERIPGESVPTSLMAWLEKIDADMQELAGTFDVLQGNAPQGITAGTALRLLLERARTRFTPLLEDLERVDGLVYSDLLNIFREYGNAPRIAKIVGQGKIWEVRQFVGSDLTGKVDVVVEAGSAAPVSAVGTQAVVQDLTTLGVVNPQDPHSQYKILQKFGMTSLLGEVDDEVKQAERENFEFVKHGKTPIVQPLIDNPMVHMMVHKKLALSSEFEEMEDVAKAIWLSHLEEHQMQIMEMQMQQAAMQQPAGDGESEESGKPSNNGNGNGKPPSGERSAKKENSESQMPGGIM